MIVRNEGRLGLFGTVAQQPVEIEDVAAHDVRVREVRTFPLLMFLQEIGLPVTMEATPNDNCVVIRVAADDETSVRKQLLEAKVEAMGSACGRRGMAVIVPDYGVVGGLGFYFMS